MLKDGLVQDVDLFLLTPIMAANNQFVVMHHITQALANHKAGPSARKNLLEGIQRGEIQSWLGLAGEEGNRRIVGMLFTIAAIDRYLDLKKLTIYGLHMKEQLSPEAISKCLSTLEAHAKKYGFAQIEAVTAIRGIGKLLERHGWTNGQSILTKEI